MTLTLKSAITATQTTIDVDGTDVLNNGDLYAIEDEQIFIVSDSVGDTQPGQTAWQRLTVQRGVLGTTEVAHAAATAVTAVTTPLGAGGVQTVSLVGPVEVPHNHPDIAGNFGMVRIVQLNPNATVVKYWAVMTEAWTGTVVKLALAISDTSDGNSTQDLSVLDVSNDDTSLSPEYAREISTGYWGGAPSGFPDSLVGRAGPNGAWLVAYLGPGTPTNGTVDVYALIAEPA